MKGYCQEDKTMVEVSNPQTVRLPNLSYIHRGTCPKCRGVIFVKIQDRQLIMTGIGHKVPMEVYSGPSTPRKILDLSAGQNILTRTAKGDYITETKPSDNPDGKIKTVWDIKQEETRK